jgi:hypothetical protein
VVIDFESLLRIVLKTQATKKARALFDAIVVHLSVFLLAGTRRVQPQK